MADKKITIQYKIYMEAEDVSQSRILSCSSFVQNLFENCGSPCFCNVKVDNESDMDDFTLRLYVDHTVTEEITEVEAGNFCGDMAEFLDKIAMAQSFLDMEGSFMVDVEGKKESYKFTSESNQDYCEFDEIAE